MLERKFENAQGDELLIFQPSMQEGMHRAYLYLCLGPLWSLTAQTEKWHAVNEARDDEAIYWKHHVCQCWWYSMAAMLGILHCQTAEYGREIAGTASCSASKSVYT